MRRRRMRSRRRALASHGLRRETALRISIVGKDRRVGEDRDATSSNAFATKGVDGESRGDGVCPLTEQGACQSWTAARNRTADKRRELKPRCDVVG